MKRFWLVLLVVCPALVTASQASDLSQVTESFSTGQVNWSLLTVTSRGFGLVPPDRAGTPRARPMAQRAAVLDAMRNLLQIIGGLPVDDRTRVGNLVPENAPLWKPVPDNETLYQNLGGKWLDPGTFETRLSYLMPGHLFQNILARDSFDRPTGESDKETYTGLVIDARATNLRPALFPQVLAADGRPLYGPTLLPKNIAVAQGACIYLKNTASPLLAARAGKNPLLLQAATAQGQIPCNPMLFESDARKLAALPEMASILAQAKVVILVSEIQPKK